MAKVTMTHMVDAYERGGRFGEDILSVKCRYCGKIWKDEAKLSAKRIGNQPCPARTRHAARDT